MLLLIKKKDTGLKLYLLNRDTIFICVKVSPQSTPLSLRGTTAMKKRQRTSDCHVAWLLARRNTGYWI